MAIAPLLTLSQITLGFGGRPLFADISLSLSPGERVCLVGRNGSGKSTLLKLIAGLVEADQGERSQKPDVTVSYLEQDPDLSAFPTLFDYAVSELEPDEHYKGAIALEGLKIDGATLSQKASGGERRKAALAKIVAEAPDLMLLDEPTNHLDIASIAWLEEYLEQSRSAFLVISHDRSFLRKLSRSVLYLDRGVMRKLDQGFGAFEAWQEKLFEEEEQERHKLNRLIKAEARWAVEGISARRKRNQGRVRRLNDLREERASQIKKTAVAKMELAAAPISGKSVLRLEHISHRFGNKQIVKDFSLQINRGDCLAIIGPNGVGKTTLLKIMMQDIAPDEGRVTLGTNLKSAIFDQTRSKLNPEQSLWDALANDSELGVSGKNDQILVRGVPKHVAGYLKEFLFTDEQLRQPVSALSGGEKARLLLARLMAKETNLLVLDEPTNDLDLETLDLLQELIADFDGTVFLVSHDRDFIDRVATATIAMEGDGQATLYAGGYSDYLDQKPDATPKLEKGKAKAEKSKTPASSNDAKPGKLSFKLAHRLKELPAEIARLEAEISKLEALLADPELYTREPKKFAKATEALSERHERLDAAETEWLELEELNAQS